MPAEHCPALLVVNVATGIPGWNPNRPTKRQQEVCKVLADALRLPEKLLGRGAQGRGSWDILTGLVDEFQQTLDDREDFFTLGFYVNRGPPDLRSYLHWSVGQQEGLKTILNLRFRQGREQGIGRNRLKGRWFRFHDARDVKDEGFVGFLDLEEGDFVMIEVLIPAHHHGGQNAYEVQDRPLPRVVDGGDA